MWVESLGWEDPLEEVMAAHSSILPWRIPWTEEPGGPRSIGLQKIGLDFEATWHVLCFLNFFIFNWRIIALQYCVGFCHISTWISHRYHTSPPFWTSSHLPPVLHLYVYCNLPTVACTGLHTVWRALTNEYTRASLISQLRYTLFAYPRKFPCTPSRSIRHPQETISLFSFTVY